MPDSKLTNKASFNLAELTPQLRDIARTSRNRHRETAGRGDPDSFNMPL